MGPPRVGVFAQPRPETDIGAPAANPKIACSIREPPREHDCGAGPTES